MDDARTGLEKGTVLKLRKDFIIEEEVGRGSSCLVYDGFYEDSLGRHKVRIKECFPYQLDVKRDEAGTIAAACGCEKGTIAAAFECEARFEEAKLHFCEAQKKNNDIRNIPGLTNETAYPLEIYEGNHTVYSVMGYTEGTGYDKFADRCLQDVFMRMKKLCKIVGNYHKEGYLHLDIKPQNMLIPFDTRDQVVLFDFDSLLETRHLQEEGEIRLSYTEGFSAPELVQGDMEKISAATDVYSVGAVIFFKLFGKKPGVWERAWNAEYPFSEMRFLDERYQPKLFSRLTTFFHKTLHSEVSMRYQKMEDVYAALEELERLSDVEGMTLLHNFSYKFSQFVGRGEELAQIQNAFTEADVIFLAGMGGIGKTELARRFAHEFRNEFNRIVFLRFTNGIMETVCSDELVVTGCDKEEQESPAEFYARKLSNLKRVAGRDDLLILDNFDKSGKDHAIEADAHLNDLLNCGCKILVTTRETFWREYNYVQIDVGVLKSDTQRRELFRINNGKNYSRDEWESINELFCLFENHTMTIALFAKYLFYIEETPSKLLERMKEKEGVANAAKLSVRHNKDESRKERLIYGHLQALFDLSGFTGLEAEMMRSISLLGEVRIKKAMFRRVFEGRVDTAAALARLVERGWMEYDEKTDMISLHQIILDLTYNSLNPTSENCRQMTRAMIMYFQKREESAVHCENRRKLADNFVNRIGGKDYLRAELYYTYCKYIGRAGEKRWAKVLEEAKQICKKLRSPTNSMLLARLRCLEIGTVAKEIDWTGVFLDDELSERLDDMLDEVYEKVFALETSIFTDLKNAALQRAENAEGDVVRFLLELADTMEKLGDDICEEGWMMETSGSSGVAKLYYDVERICLYACKLAERGSGGHEVKEAVYKKLIAFYSEADFGNFARTSCVGDEAKSAYYSEKLHETRVVLTGGNEGFNSGETSYQEAAEQARREGRYEEAISLYKKAIEKGEWDASLLQCEIGRAYLELEEFEKAEKTLLTVLKAEEENKADVSAILAILVQLYERRSDAGNVVFYCNQIVQEQLPFSKEGDLEAVTNVLAFGIKKAKWEGGGKIASKREEYLAWNACFHILDGCEILDDVLVEAYLEYAKYCWEINCAEEALELLFSAAEKYRKGWWRYDSAWKVYASIVEEGRFFQVQKDLYIKSVLGIAMIYAEEGDSKGALALCGEVERLLQGGVPKGGMPQVGEMGSGVPDAEYIRAMLRKLEAEIYTHSDDYDFDAALEKERQCDYYLLTERELKEQEGDTADAIDAWKDAMENYIRVGNEKMVAACLGRIRQEAERDGRMSGFFKYYTACLRWDQEANDRRGASIHTKMLYDQLLQYVKPIGADVGDVDSELCLQVMRSIGDMALLWESYDVAFYSRLLCVLIVVDDEYWMNRPEVEKELPERAVLEEYIGRADVFFPDVPEAEKLDEVVRLLENMMEKMEGKVEFRQTYDKLTEIEKRYKTTQVEFRW